MSPERKQRILRILRVFAITFIALLVIIPFALGFMTIWFITHSPCAPGTSPAEHGMTDYERVSFPAQTLDSELNGYFVRGSNGVTIIVPPTLSSGAGNWRQEYVALNRHGYNVFNFESRACAGHPNTMGYSEVEEVGDALDYLATRGDVDMGRIAIHGFSAGGATSIMAAARYPQIKAVIAMGGYHDFAEMLAHETQGQWYGILYGAGARLAYRLATGNSMEVLSPISVIEQIAPRPIQLIYGTREPSLSGARQQLATAGANARLVEVVGATHGSYWHTAGQEFEATIISFLDSAFDITR